VIGRDDWGYPLARTGSDVPITAENHDAAQEAVALCPTLALRFLR